MPAVAVSSQLVPAQGQEVITIMDDFATPFQLYVQVAGDPAQRAQLITGALAQQTANETALKTYASTHNIDLTAQLAAGATVRAAAIAAASAAGTAFETGAPTT